MAAVEKVAVVEMAEVLQAPDQVAEKVLVPDSDSLKDQWVYFPGGFPVLLT
jgi:hypothetical protein